jgi:CubicO group peptidase (beta-lactamase class C family)
MVQWTSSLNSQHPQGIAMAASRNRVTILMLLCVSVPSLLSQSAPQNDPKERIEKVESCLPEPVLLKGEQPTCTTLTKRMAELHVPGVSIAVVHHGVIEWARGYGVSNIGGDPVTAYTLFQAGSISKPVAAMAALHLVQEGKLSLDADVNVKLKTWKVPESPEAPGAVVTLREMLTHTAGFTVHGFPGYAATDPMPTLVQVLNGEKPANTGAIRLESLPGSKWNYSGGGYTVMQQLLIDVSGKSFSELLHNTVLTPIGMTYSTYEQPLPAELRTRAATPYQSDGQAVPGGAHTYRELAAAGLWTTPSDIARYIIENQRSLQGEANHVLSQALTRQMLTSGKGNWGLGVEMGGSPSNPYFSHGGVNAGFESLFVGYEQGGEGAVVMTNAQGGERLAEQIMSSIAVAYNWPDFQPAVRTTIAVAPSVLARYVGTYQAAPGFNLTYTLENGQLMTQATGQQKFPVFPESQTRFFLKVVNAEIEFFTDDKGQVSYLILYQNGQGHKALKIK